MQVYKKCNTWQFLVLHNQCTAKARTHSVKNSSRMHTTEMISSRCTIS
jgi:hypothetical protein